MKQSMYFWACRKRLLLTQARWPGHSKHLQLLRLSEHLHQKLAALSAGLDGSQEDALPSAMQSRRHGECRACRFLWRPMHDRRSHLPPPTSLLVHITDRAHLKKTLIREAGRAAHVPTGHGLLVAVELFHICVPGSGLRIRVQI